MAVGDVYAVKMHTEFLLQAMLNVFYYRTQVQVAAEGATELFAEFDADVLSDWDGTVIDGVTLPLLEVFKIADPFDFFSAVPVNNQGLRADIATERLPSWVTFSYKSNRAGPGSRSSYKRFTGMTEDDQQANVLSPAFLALAPVLALQSSLAADLTSPAGSIWEPVQVAGGWVLGSLPTVNFAIDNWLIPTLSSQTSRKP